LFSQDELLPHSNAEGRPMGTALNSGFLAVLRTD